MKTRMTSADIAVETACLRAMGCIGMRVANVYDINAKTYLIKLSRSGGETGESQKVLLLLESAVRFHSTQFARDKSSMPSNFTVKLRKHLRSRRLESVQQLGLDRVVDFTFGSGDAAYHLILELYSSGNVILTDCNYNILTLLRSYKDETKGVATMANHPYPIEGVKEPTTCDRATLEAALRAAAAEPTEKGPKTLKQAVGSALAYGPSIVEHCILSAGLKPSAGVEPSLLPPQSDLMLDALCKAVAELEDWLQVKRLPRLPHGCCPILLESASSADQFGVKNDYLDLVQ
ncbi:hypothetical protein CYMTET_42082 [Cymbomonas tetramitiformis]|uniref:Uncharacterized protein n=1 Tax=Cymbomonas tetramitiformis TaxID=36881 RepID=A0AAE0F1W2_9CHLO|nr:hypothetical protein CYMTET_42082 [Cymbomonas tetramitiformis]